MQVSVTSTEGLERRLTVEVPAERVEKEVVQRLKGLAGRVRLDGFRPGKVPMKVMEKRYGAQVRQEVQADVMQHSFYEAIEQESLRPAGSPKLELGESDSEKFEFSAIFEVYPEVKVEVPSDLVISKPTVAVQDSDVDGMIEKLRGQRTSWEAADRAAENGDQVVIDFLGKVDGEAFAGGEAKAYPLELGSGRFIPGFEEQLVGAKAGDNVNVDVTFPESYQSEDLAGKAAVFEVTVNTVNEAKLPDVEDEEFLKALGVQEGGIDALRKDVRESMEREAAQKVAAKVKDSALDQLLNANTIDLPNSLIENEIQQLAAQAGQSMGIQQEMPVTDEIRNALKERAERRVALGLLVGEVIREQGFQADAGAVRERIVEMAATYEDPDSVLKWYYEDKSRLSGVEALVLEDQAVDWIMSQAKVEEVSTPFEDLMQAAEG